MLLLFAVLSMTGKDGERFSKYVSDFVAHLLVQAVCLCSLQAR